mgnify:CR=1 FL=1
MKQRYSAVGLAEGSSSVEHQRMFAPRPTQMSKKDIVSYAPSRNQAAELAEADRKLAAGESLLAKAQPSARG